MDLSVIIPAYNEESYLERTLQALPTIEVIVVCNGCTDKTEEIARKYTSNVLVLKEKGVSRARNAGAHVASNRRLVFLDADIRVDKDLLQKIRESSYTVGTCKALADSSFLLDNILMHLKSELHRFGYCTGLLFIDKNIFEKAGKFEEHLSKKEDGRLLRRARKYGHFGVVNGYVFNNMRRYRKKGYLRICLYWIREYLFPTKTEYESVR